MSDETMRLVKLEPKPKPKPEWSPIEMLEELLVEVRAGREQPLRLLVCWTERTEGGGERFRRWQSNCSCAEEVAFHSVAMHYAIEDWRK